MRAKDKMPMWSAQQLMKTMVVERGDCTFAEALALSNCQNKTEEGNRLTISERITRFLLHTSVELSKADRNYIALAKIITGRQTRSNAPLEYDTVLPFLSCLESILPVNLPNPPKSSKNVLTKADLTRVLQKYPLPEGGSDTLLEMQMQAVACMWWRSINNLPCTITETGWQIFTYKQEVGWLTGGDGTPSACTCHWHTNRFSGHGMSGSSWKRQRR